MKVNTGLTGQGVKVNTGLTGQGVKVVGYLWSRIQTVELRGLNERCRALKGIIYLEWIKDSG